MNLRGGERAEGGKKKGTDKNFNGLEGGAEPACLDALPAHIMALFPKS